MPARCRGVIMAGFLSAERVDVILGESVAEPDVKRLPERAEQAIERAI